MELLVMIQKKCEPKTGNCIWKTCTEYESNCSSTQTCELVSGVPTCFDDCSKITCSPTEKCEIDATKKAVCIEKCDGVTCDDTKKCEPTTGSCIWKTCTEYESNCKSYHSGCAGGGTSMPKCVVDPNETNFAGADLEGEDLTGLNNCAGGDFTGANLKGVDFSNLDCTGADFTSARFGDDTKFINTTLINTIFDNVSLVNYKSI